MRKRSPNTKIINCRNCNKEIEVPYSSKRYLCDECKQYSIHNHFSARKEQKILCSNPNCNNVVRIEIRKTSTALESKRGEILCKECKGKEHLKERVVKCKKCGKTIRTEILHDTYQLKPVIYEICDDCKKPKSKPSVPKREKIIQKTVCKRCGAILNESKLWHYKNPIKWGLCNTCKVLSEEERRKRYSERMSKNNPMFSKETREKVFKTLKQRIEKGEVTYAKGKDHHLFKGLRPFNHDVRSHLYNLWIHPVLQRDNFKCTKCGANKNLQVHHVKPLREICDEVFKELGIPAENTLFTRETYGDEIYEKALSKVLEKHKLEYGVTLCKDCHNQEDYYYRPYKGEIKRE